MTREFNLLEQPWLRAIEKDGSVADLGLRQVLARAHELRELSGDTPLETAALHRLLLALLHRLYGPEGYGAWSDLWQAGRFDPARVDDYLERWRHRFNLFDAQRPFFQAADRRVVPKAVNSLVPDLGFGNKATLFDHHTDEEGVSLTAARAARALVAAQAFGLAGLSGLPDKFTDGPCTRGAIFFVQGDSLFETLVLNMLRYPTRDDVLAHHPGDRPAWEMDDPFEPPRTRPLGYLDYLTWQNRRVLLFGEDGPQGPVVRRMTVAPGLRLDAGVADPMKHYRLDPKRGPLVERFDEERALWRDSAALFKLGQAQAQEVRPPRTFLWLAELLDEGCLEARPRRLMALGMANNQARVDFYRDERMPLHLRFLVDERLVERLEEALHLAEAVRGQLWGAVRMLARLFLVPQADLVEGHEPAPEAVQALMSQWGAERDFWSRLEIPFRQVVEDLPEHTDEAMAGWQRTVRRVAWEAFDRVASALQFQARGLKAAVRGRGQLAAGLARLLPDS